MPIIDAAPLTVPPATPDRLQKAQKVPLPNVVAEFWGTLDYTSDHRFLTTCPKHPGDTAARLEVQGNRLYCWTCKWGGSSDRVTGIDLVRHVRGCSVDEAVHLILALEKTLKDRERNPLSTPPLASWVIDATRDWMAATPKHLRPHSTRLGISAQSLWKIGCMPGPEPNRLFAVMRWWNGNIVGLWQEVLDGVGVAVNGSLPAPFLPRDDYDPPGPVYLAAGPLNTAALLHLDLPAIGWPSGMWTTNPTAVAKAARERAAVVVVREHRGELSAVTELCWALHEAGSRVSVAILPPACESVLAWVQQGGDAETLQGLAEPLDPETALASLPNLHHHLQPLLDRSCAAQARTADRPR